MDRRLILRHGYSHLPRHGTTTQRGYGREHQQRRAALLPHAYGAVCPLCSQLMWPSDRLDLDHSTPLATNQDSIGDRIVHAACNRRRGGVPPLATPGRA